MINALIGRRVRLISLHAPKTWELDDWYAHNDLKIGVEGEIVNVVPPPRKLTDETLVVRLDVNGALVRMSERVVITSGQPKANDTTVINLLKQILKAVSKKN
jgi:hypothetical protein